MTLKTRFTLIGVGIIIFLIAVPPLILFAGGFKIDWNNFSIVKTGTLEVETRPRGATVYLNGKKQRKTTPSTIRFLIPQDFQVRVEKQDYQTWSKRLSVKSQLVTWANLNRDYIALFFSQPKTLENFDAEKIFISSNQQELVFIKGNGLYSLTINSEKPASLGPTNLLKSPFEFNETLDWQNGKNVYEELKALSASEDMDIPENLEKISTNGHITILQYPNSIQVVFSNNQMELETKTYFSEGNTLWFVQDSTLKKLDLYSQEKRSIISDLPQFENGQIIRSNNHVFLLLDNNLYFVNQNLQQIAGDIKFASWNYGTNKLLLASSNELSLFDPENLKTELILRTVSQLSNARLNAETGYLFFINEGKIKAIELDGRDQRNIFEFGEAHNGFMLSDDAKLLHDLKNNQITIKQIR